jgi:hypothetical protein
VFLINYRATFEERVEEQIEIQTYCDEIFGDRELLTMADYSDLIKTKTSEMFLSVSNSALIIDHVDPTRQTAVLELLFPNARIVQAEARACHARRANHSTNRVSSHDPKEGKRRASWRPRL